MITQIADILTRAGLQFTAREIEDIVWLATQIDEPLPGGPPAVSPEAMSDDEDIDNLEDEPIQNGAANEQSLRAIETTELRQAESVMPLYADGMQGSLAGSTLRVRGLSQSPAPDVLRRALQPFMRRAPSSWQFRLDEEATVTRTADTGIWMPVFTAVLERRFDLTLVIEDCTSADLREATLRDLSKRFRNYSGLREVRCYRLRGDTPLSLVTMDGKSEYSLEHLKTQTADNGRHLVLFATDGTSSRWRNGSAQAFLHIVGANASVSLLHLLPQAAWRRTLIGEPDVALHCERPGVPNIRFKTILPWWIDSDEVRGTLPVPVLGLDASSVGIWARAISAFGGATMPGVLVDRPAATLGLMVPPSATAHDPVKVVARYRNMASDSAYRLAVYLSKTNPVTIPIMRLVQRTMLPNSGEGELAEFLLGGLVTRVQQRAEQAESLYSFRDGVADELLKALRFSEEETIARQLALVGGALESIGNGPHDLEVAFPAPAGEARLSEWAMPFATVSRQILRAQTQLEATPIDLDSTIDELALESGRASFRLLHLSGLHFGRPSATEPKGALGPFGPLWLKHLAQLAENNEVDLVCISGDLTWSGSTSEFSELDEFLDNSLAALGLPRNRLFVVPGNHDMRWESRLSRRNASQSFAATAGTLTGGEADAVARSQSNYREWLKRYLPHQSAVTRDKYSDFRLSIIGWVVPVRIIGIDSAWKTSIGRGAVLAAEQLQALNASEPDGLSIALIHHQPQQLQSPSDLRERLARARVNILLHGHGYEEASTISMDGNYPMVSSGVAFSARSDNSIAFHVIDFALDAKNGPAVTQISVHEWDKRASRWAPRGGPDSREPENWKRLTEQRTSELEPQEIFVGRDVELKRLLQILNPEKARAGRPARCMIVGPPGIGKTTLSRQFLTSYWLDNEDQEDRYVFLAARRGEAFEDQLLKKFSYSSAEGLFDHLNDRQTLVVIDDIDSLDQMIAANRFAEILPACPVLLIGRFQGTGTAESTGWDMLTLAQLPEWESVQLLRLLLRSNDSEIANADAVAIVAALHGLPALVRLVGEHLTKPTSATRLTEWLGAAYSGELSPVLSLELVSDFPWLRRALSPVFENRWHAELDVESLDVLSALAHGPISGFSTSLGLALSGYARRTASAASTQKFTSICDSAVASGLLRRSGPEWSFTAPAYVAWLRERGSKRRNPAIRRWSDWLSIRMAAPAKSRTRLWREINELPSAMIEWLATCPPDVAQLVRPVCIPYAVMYGPIDAWQQFCWRMLQTHAKGDKDSADWYFTLAELSYAKQDLGAALEAVDQYLRLKERTTKVDNRLEASINAGIRLRNRILADQGRSPEVPLQQRSAPPFSMPDEEILSEPRPHQRYLANAALAATLRAGRETTCIGLVVQTIGSGISNTLATYLKACLYDRSLQRSKIIVVADRINVIRELVYILERMHGIDMTEPQTVENLMSAVRSEHAPVIVTTEHKLRQLPSKYNGDCLVIGFSLRRPSRSLVTHLPRAQMIVFGNESLVLTLSLARSLGPVIANYPLQEAIRDGYVVAPMIRSFYANGMFTYRSDAGRRGAQLSLAGITMIVEHFQKYWYSHDTSSPDKRVLIVESEPDAWLLAESLAANRGAIDSEIMVLAGSVSHKQETLADFRRSASSALLVTTTGMAPGLPLAGIDVCYVAAQLTLTTQLKIVSFVNIPITGRKYGEIIDFVDHDWRILELAN